MTSLIDRYVAASVDDFPAPDSDIAQDVRAAVEDLVEAEIVEGLTPEQAERAALEELGEPRRFAEQFRQEPRYLIGPEIFHRWWKTLKLVIGIVVPLFVLLAALEFYTQDSGNVLGFFGEVIGAVVEGVIQASFWVTLFFAIFQFAGYKNEEAKTASRWTPDDLPEVQTGRQITISEVLVGLLPLIGATYMAVKIRDDQLGVLGLNHLYDVPADTVVFNPELSNWWGIGFFGLLISSLLVSIWSFVRGYWTRDVLVVNLLDCAVWIVYLIGLGSAGDILNPVIVEASSRSDTWTLSADNTNRIIIGIMLLIVAWSAFEPIKGHLDYRKRLRNS